MSPITCLYIIVVIFSNDIVCSTPPHPSPSPFMACAHDWIIGEELQQVALCQLASGFVYGSLFFEDTSFTVV